MSTFCKDTTTNKEFVTIFAYAPANNSHKRNFWQELHDYCLYLTHPFIVIGDLNEILCLEDKLGGNIPTLERFKMLNEFMNNTNTMDIPFTGNRYTWRKKEAGNDNILERLDRALVHNDWYNDFPNASIKHIDFSISDHTPIILTTY